MKSGVISLEKFPANMFHDIADNMMLISFVYLCCSAGVFCAIVSHPADTVVSKLNNDVGSTPIQAARDLGMKGEYTYIIKVWTTC